MAVYRIYVEKKAEYAVEAQRLQQDIVEFLRIETLEALRLLNRYDVEGIDEAVFRQCRSTVFSEPQVDTVFDVLPVDTADTACRVFAVEPLPGQYDQRSDSCAQCIQMVSRQERPIVRTAAVYFLFGTISEEDFLLIKKHIINPVESREASLEAVQTLSLEYETPPPLAILNGFRHLSDPGIKAFCSSYALAMDDEDLRFCRDYFCSEGRDPTITELRMIDTYWSDHCRHTTFATILDHIIFDTDPASANNIKHSNDTSSTDVRAAYQRYLEIRKILNQEDQDKKKYPITLMDMATIGAKYLKRQGLLPKLDESEEINACSVHVEVDVDGKREPWLLMFKNETHNHPTEIEPFGGAATCIGGAIRDPLAGRSYVYQALRISGAGNPLAGVEETRPGKLPQRKLVTGAAAGYSSYGNQIGLATGLVREIYHPGYEAKHLELGAVIGAAPLHHIVRHQPEPGDVVILLGGRTGRDGCGGATGSSKSHTTASIEQCGSEVQKGNAPEERKLQRLFRNPRVTRLIKRCNDFGAGGVSVAIGELAPGMEIDLDAVPVKYHGLDGTELAISESQERMAVVVTPEHVQPFLNYAAEENLEATVVAQVTDEDRLCMKWQGQSIVDIARVFLDSKGAEKHACARISTKKAGSITSALDAKTTAPEKPAVSLQHRFEALLSDLNICSQKGLSERFDSTIGAATVLMPLGGTYQMTPAQVMAAQLPVLSGNTRTCSLMSYGYDPFLTEQSPFHGAYCAVVESVTKIVAAGGTRKECYLSFQEYFEKLDADPVRWGKPVAALLGALDAQLDLSVAAIGGKDSMSGTFETIHVPPTLVSFALSITQAEYIITPEFKKAGSKVVLIAPAVDTALPGIPVKESLCRCLDEVESLIREKKVSSAFALSSGGLAEALFKMCLGNRLGFHLQKNISRESLFVPQYGALVLELAEDTNTGLWIGNTISEYHFIAHDTTRSSGDTLPDIAISLDTLQHCYESVLQSVFPYGKADKTPVPLISFEATTGKRSAHAAIQVLKNEKPKAFIPVFPGTNCEYDTARALERAGAEPVMLVIRNLTKEAVAESIERADALLKESHIMVIPGGFSGGDEPDGSGKFITAFFRNPRLQDRIGDFLERRDGLICGICNGFQGLIKLGLVPFGHIIDPDPEGPTLTFNKIGRHQSMLVRTRIASNQSPWLMGSAVGDIYTIPVSHGEGRFIAQESLIQDLIRGGQIAAQYVDPPGNPTMDERYNPNGSMYAVEALTSPDGRVLGKMGHTERRSIHTYKNVPGNTDQRIFENAVAYFQ
ncbi:MAG: phosphoribosylformylglycinamidine synthase [Treponema sp.]|jgi:phosphoribosylformylglycinamidine synthase|nr:phosphoribosylformylglycinamidine synthase [Treponema sp.]